MKVVVEDRVKRYARLFGIEFRQSDKPSEAGIMGVDKIVEKHDIPAIQLGGTGVVWICKTVDGKKWSHADVQFMALHEVGHAILGFFPKLKISRRDHEVKANAIALSLCVHLGIRVRPKMIERLSQMTRMKKLV